MRSPQTRSLRVGRPRLGSALGWALAAFAADRVERYVGISVGHPATFVGEDFEQREKSWYMLFFQFEGVAEEWLRADDWANLRAWVSDGGRRADDLDRWIADLTRPGRLEAALGWYRANVPPTSWVGEDAFAFPPVACPTMGVWSSNDMALTEGQMTRSASNVSGDFRYERIDGVSHWIPVEAPDKLNTSFSTFCDRAAVRHGDVSVHRHRGLDRAVAARRSGDGRCVGARTTQRIRSVVERHGGTVFKHTGDGMCAVFVSAPAAVAAAVEAQAGLELPVRMGLHTGEAESRDGDYFGPTLNRAARVMDAGHGGQVLVSSATAGLVRGSHDLVDLGEHQLKGLDSTERIFQVGQRQFPALRTPRPTVGNLPIELSTFVGRRTRSSRWSRSWHDHRLVTLIGVGGTGKTRLAVETAHDGFGDRSPMGAGWWSWPR